jgi:hypothetical protein
MTLIKLTILFAVISQLFTLHHTPLLYAATHQSIGRVTGTVHDPNEAVIVGRNIIFRGEGIERIVKTNDEGVYEVELPAGIYQVFFEAQAGFLSYRRAPFRVEASKSIIINIALTMSSVPGHIFYIGPPEKAPRFPPDKPLKYDSFLVANLSPVPLEMLVEFKNKRKRGAYLEYRRATASYNSLLIYGDKLRFNKKHWLIEGEGNVILEDGKRRMKVNRVVAKIKDGMPEIISVER